MCAQNVDSKFLDEISKEVADSTESIGKILIYFLFILFTVLVEVFSTTDKMLLLNHDGLKFPFVDLSVPLVGFYLAAPVFILFLHINLLSAYELHRLKLLKFQQAWDGDVPRENIKQSLFNISILDKRNPFHDASLIIVDLFVIYAGPIAIGVIFWRFTDFQSGWVSMCQLFLFVTNLYFVRKLNLTIFINIVGAHAKKCRWYSRLVYFLKTEVILACPQSGKISKLLYLVFIFGIATEALLVLWVVSTDGNVFATQYKRWIQRFNEGSAYSALVLPTISIDIHEQIIDESLLKKAANVGPNEDPIYAHWVKRDATLHLKSRSLRMAHFGNADLTHVNFSGAEMQGAIFIMADLHGAYMGNVGLQGANMFGARLKGTDFSSAKLNGATLAAVYMEDTVFKYADLSNTVFQNANLKESQVEHAILTGADINVIK